MNNDAYKSSEFLDIIKKSRNAVRDERKQAVFIYLNKVCNSRSEKLSNQVFNINNVKGRDDARNDLIDRAKSEILRKDINSRNLNKSEHNSDVSYASESRMVRSDTTLGVSEHKKESGHKTNRKFDDCHSSDQKNNLSINSSEKFDKIDLGKDCCDKKNKY